MHVNNCEIVLCSEHWRNIETVKMYYCYTVETLNTARNSTSVELVLAEAPWSGITLMQVVMVTWKYISNNIQCNKIAQISLTSVD